MRTRALTTSEVASKLMEMGLQNFRHTRIEDNEITLPFGESKSNDIYYTVEIWDAADGRTWVTIFRFVRNYWEGKDLGASGKPIFKYTNASASQKKLFMELMEKEFSK